MKLPTKKTQLNLILSVIAALVIAVIYVFGYTQVNNKLSTVNEVSHELNVKELEAQNIAEISNQLQQTASARSKLFNLFLPPNGIISFLNSLESLALQQGVELVISQADRVPIENNDSLAEVNLNLSLAGDFDSIYEYIVLLTRQPVDVAITSLSINRASYGDGAALDPELAANDWFADVSLTVLELQS